MTKDSGLVNLKRNWSWVCIDFYAEAEARPIQFKTSNWSLGRPTPDTLGLNWLKASHWVRQAEVSTLLWAWLQLVGECAFRSVAKGAYQCLSLELDGLLDPASGRVGQPRAHCTGVAFTWLRTEQIQVSCGNASPKEAEGRGWGQFILSNSWIQLVSPLQMPGSS